MFLYDSIPTSPCSECWKWFHDIILVFFLVPNYFFIMNRLETNLINLEKVQIESLLILILVRKLQTDKNIQNFFSYSLDFEDISSS